MYVSLPTYNFLIFLLIVAVFSYNNEVDMSILLPILIVNPEEFEFQFKPDSIREDAMFTFNMNKVPPETANADGNGA